MEALAEQPEVGLAEQPVEALAEQPVEALAEQPVEALVEQPVEALVEQPVEALVEQPVEALALWTVPELVPRLAAAPKTARYPDLPPVCPQSCQPPRAVLRPAVCRQPGFRPSAAESCCENPSTDPLTAICLRERSRHRGQIPIPVPATGQQGQPGRRPPISRAFPLGPPPWLWRTSPVGQPCHWPAARVPDSRRKAEHDGADTVRDNRQWKQKPGNCPWRRQACAAQPGSMSARQSTRRHRRREIPATSGMSSCGRH